jgi:hypothetical protein
MMMEIKPYGLMNINAPHLQFLLIHAYGDILCVDKSTIPSMGELLVSLIES